MRVKFLARENKGNFDWSQTLYWPNMSLNSIVFFAFCSNIVDLEHGTNGLDPSKKYFPVHFNHYIELDSHSFLVCQWLDVGTL